MIKTKSLVDSKFIRLLHLLNKEEVKSFQKFLESPYFNKKEHLVKLYSLLSNFHPKFDSPRFNKAAILKKMFSDTASALENKLAKQMTELVQLFDEFLKHQVVKEDDIVSHSLLIRALSKKANFELSITKSKAYQKLLNEHPVRDSKFYYEQFSIFHDLYLQSLQTSFDGEKEYLLQSKKHLDQFYHLTRLALICGLFARNKLLKDQFELSSMNKFIQQVKDNYINNSPVFSIYIQLIELYQNVVDDTLFRNIVKSFKNHVDLFSKEQQSSIIYQLSNYAVVRMKANQKSFQCIQTDALFNLETELIRDAREFCESSEPVAVWLRKRFRERLRALGGRNREFDEAYMTPKKGNNQDSYSISTAVDKPAEDKIKYLYILNLLRYVFLPTLSPVEQVLFEVKRIHGLKGKNGIFQVAHFFANTATIGHEVN